MSVAYPDVEPAPSTIRSPSPSPEAGGACYACDALAVGLSERWEDGQPLYRLACPRHRSHALPEPYCETASVLPGWVRLVREPQRFASDVLEGDMVRFPGDVARIVGPRLACEEVEVMVVIALNSRRHVLAAQEIARGGVSGLSVSTREVYRLAIALGASALVISHNHPNGNPVPSEHDDAMTATVLKAGRLVGIPLVDHVVIASQSRWHSYLESGRLERLAHE